jgi:hypothetical protein
MEYKFSAQDGLPLIEPMTNRAKNKGCGTVFKSS